MIFKNLAVAAIASIAVASQLKHNIAQTDAELENAFCLAETDSELVPHNCIFSQNRSKTPSDPFYSVYNGTTMYTDKDFMPDQDSLFWGDMGESNGTMAQQKGQI